MRYGSMFGPNITFLGIPECDLDEVNSYKDADVVIIGAVSYPLLQIPTKRER